MAKLWARVYPGLPIPPEVPEDPPYPLDAFVYDTFSEPSYAYLQNHVPELGGQVAKHPNSADDMWIYPGGLLSRNDGTSAAWSLFRYPTAVPAGDYAIEWDAVKTWNNNVSGRVGVIASFNSSATTGYICVSNGVAAKGWTLYVANAGTITEVAHFVDAMSRDFMSRCRLTVTFDPDFSNRARLRLYVDHISTPVINYLCSTLDTFTTGYVGTAAYGPYENRMIDNFCARTVWITTAIVGSAGLTSTSEMRDFPDQMDPEEDATNLTRFFIDDMETGTFDSRRVDLHPDNANGWNMGQIYGNHSNNDEKQYYILPADAGMYQPFSMTSYTDALGHNEACLRITGRKTPAGQLAASGNKPYQSGIITRFTKGNQLYGRITSRVCHAQGKGVWDGGWMIQGNGLWPCEIDWSEAFGADNGRTEGGPGMISNNFIMRNVTRLNGVLLYAGGVQARPGRYLGGLTPWYAPWSDFAGHPDGHSNFNWHWEDIWWTQNAIMIYINGQQRRRWWNPPFSETGAAGAHLAMHPQWQLAIGGEWPTNGNGGGTVDETKEALWQFQVGKVQQFGWDV